MKRYTHLDDHSNTSHNIQGVEATKLSVERGTDEEGVGYDADKEAVLYTTVEYGSAAKGARSQVYLAYQSHSAGVRNT